MAEILILGSSGQLGSDLIEVFSNSQHVIYPLARNKFDGLKDNVASEFAKYKNVDYIINCIATTNVDACEDNPNLAFMINSGLTYHLAKFCNENSIILFHISTDYVFDGAKQVAYTEEDQPNPLNIYGLSKYSGELIVANYLKKYFIFRVCALFGVAGASGKGGNFVTTMLRLAKEKNYWNVISDQLTCPTHTLDIARAIKSFVDNQVTQYGIYNCASNNYCSWFEFAQEIMRQNNVTIDKIKPISYKDYQFKAIRPQYAIMSTNKLSKYYKMPTYKQALAEYLKLKFQHKNL